MHVNHFGVIIYRPRDPSNLYSGFFFLFRKGTNHGLWGTDMIGMEHRSSSNARHLELQKSFIAPRLFGAVLGAAALAVFVVGLSNTAKALPSFARQTGQPCGTCHTDFPGLTPYGRLFKLNGYTAGGGKFRTTLFPSQNDATNALAAYAKKFGGGQTPIASRRTVGHQQHLGAANFDDGDCRLHPYTGGPTGELAV